MHAVDIVLLVVLLGALTGIAARYTRAIPLPLMQIALGALLSWPRQGLHIAFDPDLFLALFIPPLLFADGWRIPKREFFALRLPILRLALGLVLFTVLGLGALIHWLLPGIPLAVAFALAAVVSPTDAVAVAAITRNLGLPPRTLLLLQGESLLNDASGLVALKFAVGATLTGAFSWSAAAREFLWLALGGLALGALLGWGFAVARDAITRRVGDVAATQLVLLLVLLPFAAYMLADRVGVSGILAAVAAGVTTNFADLRRSAFIAERMQSEGAWTMMEAAFNGAVFLLLGLQLPSIVGSALLAAGDRWWLPLVQALAISLALLGLRWIWLTLAVLGRVQRDGHKPPALLTLCTTLAGIRGAVTLAGALSVPLLLADGSAFPAREQLVFLATGTILCTLVIGSIGLPLILRRLPAGGEPSAGREEREARLAACRAAIAFLVQPSAVPPQTDAIRLAQGKEAAGRLTQDYRQRIDLLEEPATGQTPEAQAEAPDAVRQRRQRYLVEMELRLQTLRVERETLYAERHAARINDESLRTLVAELDLLEVSLRHRVAAARRALGLPHGPA